MVITRIVRRGAALAALCFLPGMMALAAPAAPQVEPRVSRPTGTPCVVDLFHNQPFNLGTYSYAPPPGCPGPWTKVVLAMNLTGARGAGVSVISMDLAGVKLFVGSTQQTDTPSTWHVERDLTDYASLLRLPNDGMLNTELDNGSPYVDGSAITGSAKLLFYRPTLHAPAHRVPDVVYETGSGPQTLPHNIVRAYLDVTARPDPLWYTCVPNAAAVSHPSLLSVLAPGINPPGIFPALQGCTGGSFREVRVSIDGTPAGVAQVFPWLPSDLNGLFPHSVDKPAASVQVFNLVPYRVDITPFAALLSDAGPHTVQLSGGAWTDAQLLLYLDHHKAHVTGAVIFNSLAAGAPPLTVTNTLAEAGGVLQGQLVTRAQRHFEIRGFVNASGGRIDSVVSETGKFRDTQAFRLNGLTYETLHSYRQNVWLDSTVERMSRRTRGATVLSQDHERICYPLTLRYKAFGVYDPSGDDGPIVNFTGAKVAVLQKRQIHGWHYRPTMPWYETSLNDGFFASHDRNDEGVDSHWVSARTYVFTDNFGSCYRNALTTVNGTVASTATGFGCPHGTNFVRWFAHADGSPDAIAWRP